MSVSQRTNNHNFPYVISLSNQTSSVKPGVYKNPWQIPLMAFYLKFQIVISYLPVNSRIEAPIRTAVVSIIGIEI